MFFLLHARPTAHGYQISSLIAIQAICDFKVASCVPRDRSISYQNLPITVNEITGMQVDSHGLRKLARLAITNSIFCESQHGFVGHNSSSLLLLEDQDYATL